MNRCNIAIALVIANHFTTKAFADEIVETETRDSYVRLDTNIDNSKVTNIFSSIDLAIRDDFHWSFSYSKTLNTGSANKDNNRIIVVGVEKDSLEEMPYGIDIGFNRYSNSVNTQSITPRISYFGDAWQFQFAPSIQAINLDLSRLSRNVKLFSVGINLGASYFVTDHWLLQANLGGYLYSKSPSDYRNELEFIYLLNPSIGDFVSGLEKSFIAIGGSYFIDNVSFSLDVMRSRTAIDLSTNNKSSFGMSYRWTNSVSSGLRISRQLVDNSSITSFGISISYAW